MNLATDFYEVKHRILTAQWVTDGASRRRRVFDLGTGYNSTDTFITDVLGYDPPEPVLDERGKPVKVFSTGIAYVLAEGVRDRFRTVSPKGTQQSYEVTGYTVGTSKADIGRRLAAISGYRARNHDAYEVPATSLAYPLAAANPGRWVRQVPDTNDYVLIAPEDIRTPREPR